jgi:hypothetical protein
MTEAMEMRHGNRYDGALEYDIEAVLYDVDNTLVSHAGPELPTPEFRDAVIAGRQLGMSVDLASARPVAKVRHILEYIGAEGFSILCNGAQIIDSSTLEVVEEWPIDREVCQSLIADLGKLGVGYWINDDGVDFFPADNSGGFERQTDIWDLGSARTAVSDYVPDKPFVMNLYMITAEQAAAVTGLVAGYGHPEVVTLVAHEYPQPDGSLLYDQFIVNRTGNKKHALERVAALREVPLERFAAVGDGRNDEVFVGSVGMGIAMGNAAPETLAVARMVAPHREDDGAAVAQRYLNQLKQESLKRAEKS